MQKSIFLITGYHSQISEVILKCSIQKGHFIFRDSFQKEEEGRNRIKRAQKLGILPLFSNFLK